MKVYVVLSESNEGAWYPAFNAVFTTLERAHKYYNEHKRKPVLACVLLETEIDNPIAPHRTIEKEEL